MTRHARDGAPRRRVGFGLAAGIGLVLVAGAVVVTLGWFQRTATVVAAEDPVASPASGAPATPTPTPTPTPPPDAVFTLLAAGDVLLHEPVVHDARTATGYDFGPELAAIRPWVTGVDLALCHLEVPVAPAGTSPSGYPRFGAPREIASSLAANGWDGCSTASNHSLDRGSAGVTATLDALDEVSLGHAGTARSAAESATTEVYELERAGQTIRVAHLAATYGTNGLPIAADAPWTVNLLDPGTIVARASAARAAGADVVVVSIHCCVEYVSEPTEQQVQVATELAASGTVDLVIGHHAHVPQPIALLPGGPTGQGMWVAYGLGNLVSNQDSACCSARTDSGLLMLATFRKPTDGPVTVTDVQWTAVTVDRVGGHVVQPMSALVAAGQGIGTLSAAELATRHARVAEVVGTAAPELVVAPVTTGPAPLLRPIAPAVATG